MSFRADVKIDLDDITKLVPNLKKKFSKDLKRQIVDIITDKIQSGNSPVSGHGKYKEYSEAYAKRKGVAVDDVNLNDTGEMLSSMRAFQDSEGSIKVEVNEPAGFHDTPGVARKLRKMLPGPGESFTKDVFNEILKILQGAVKL